MKFISEPDIEKYDLNDSLIHVVVCELHTYFALPSTTNTMYDESFLLCSLLSIAFAKPLSKGLKDLITASKKGIHIFGNHPVNI
jgi:hypothetical protein